MDSHAPNEQDNDAAQQHAIMHGAAPATATATPSLNVGVDARPEEVVPSLESLPLETRYPPFPLRQHAGGFWLPETTLVAGIPALHACFALTPLPTDVLLASFPKSGTTWLKALAFAARIRAAHPPSDARHPLRHSNPHECVRFLEVDFALAGPAGAAGLRDEFEALPSPRTFATHLPYSLLPERWRGRATGTGQEDDDGDGDGGPAAGCRIVYVCRDPKDALVSSWFFTRKVAPAFGADAEAFTFQEAFELFCDGRCICGPQWRHVLEYWEESVRRPGKVLFLRYEEMVLEPQGSLRKLAEFMGCGFSEEEEAAGVVDAIVELCSLDTLKNAAVNQSASGNGRLPVGNETFFRKGGAGDWRNHMTSEMAKRLDKIVEHALQGSGLTYGSSA